MAERIERALDIAERFVGAFEVLANAVREMADRAPLESSASLRRLDNPTKPVQPRITAKGVAAVERALRKKRGYG